MGKNYKPVNAGLKSIGQEAKLGAVALSAAKNLAAAANQADPKGKYEAVPKTVIAGWANESRSGAAVREGAVSWKGRRERTLARVAGQMKARGS